MIAKRSHEPWRSGASPNLRIHVEGLVTPQGRAFPAVLAEECRIYPGVATFVRSLRHLPRAIASGARREEIEIVLRRAALADVFTVIVATEDVAAGKPDPSPFLTALAALNRSGDSIAPEECLVVEDPVVGLTAAKRARMRCLAVTNSYSPIAGADLVVPSLEGVSLNDVQRIFPSPAQPFISRNR